MSIGLSKEDLCRAEVFSLELALIFKKITMRFFWFTFIFNCFSVRAHAQTISTFEEIAIPSGTNYLNNAGVSGYFQSGNTALPNTYDSQFQYWEGWAISKETNNQTPGFTNQYSAIAGSGVNSSNNYATGYSYSGTGIKVIGNAKGGVIEGVYVTNSTYTYYSMKNGDSFAKRFGGETGNDPDYFKLTVKAFLDGNQKPDSVEFYLADYRFNDNSLDYIVDQWKYIGLTELGNLDSLVFSLSSSDNGIFGMNTPAYFCVDNLTTADMTTVTSMNDANNHIKIYPNPTKDLIHIIIEQGQETAILRIFNMNGKLMENLTVFPGGDTINLSTYESGVYHIQLENSKEVYRKLVVKVD